MARLISHRRSAYVDDDELERAAGMLEIREFEEDEAGRPLRSFAYGGAACALRALNGHEIGSAEDFMTVFERSMFGNQTEGENA